jgi:hypothetical protein
MYAREISSFRWPFCGGMTIAENDFYVHNAQLDSASAFA